MLIMRRTKIVRSNANNRNESLLVRTEMEGMWDFHFFCYNYPYILLIGKTFSKNTVISMNRVLNGDPFPLVSRGTFLVPFMKMFYIYREGKRKALQNLPSWNWTTIGLSLDDEMEVTILRDDRGIRGHQVLHQSTWHYPTTLSSDNLILTVSPQSMIWFMIC